ncbi:MAG: hypothetical protein KF752_13070 [Pirellulaceae bacterium]|nr:hypothetical protein [Pirellulaceae bacterium]
MVCQHQHNLLASCCRRTWGLLVLATSLAICVLLPSIGCDSSQSKPYKTGTVAFPVESAIRTADSKPPHALIDDRAHAPLGDGQLPRVPLVRESPDLSAKSASEFKLASSPNFILTDRQRAERNASLAESNVDALKFVDLPPAPGSVVNDGRFSSNSPRSPFKTVAVQLPMPDGDSGTSLGASVVTDGGLEDWELIPNQTDSPVVTTPPPPILPSPSALADPIEIPIQGSEMGSDQVRTVDGRVALSVRDATLHSVLSMIAQQHGLSIVSPTELDVKLTMTLQPTNLENALDAIMAVSSCVWTQYNNVVYVTPLNKEANQNFLIQGRMIQVFDLSYMSANDAEKVVTGILSPVGKVFSRQLDKSDKRRSNEQLVVEDLPPYVARVSEYLARADQPPRQVMVEVRVLQVRLTDDRKHGVNLDGLLSRSGSNEIWFRTKAFASSTGPGAVFSVDSTRFDKLLDILNTTTDAKTLAAPKLLMLNGQESKIQIGQKLAYTTSTTTQTTTVQGVQFLEVGVLLTVTPHITDNGQILMHVSPKVSSGQVNPTTQLPDEETTELTTSVMVPDGTGIVIGGLIQESDIERQSKLPLLGDLWVIGRLFQRRSVDRQRTEVIVALLPRIVDCTQCPPEGEQLELERATMPLLTPELLKATRPEPTLYDAINKPVTSWRDARL